MARNKVQFQKGVSLNDFIKQYGTEDQCFDALYAWRWPKGFQCPACGHDKCCQLTIRKLQQCNRCNRQTSLTAGTIFESTKLPLTLWFQGIYLITQDKKGISAMKLHRHLGDCARNLVRLRWWKTQPPKSPLSGGLSTQFPSYQGDFPLNSPLIRGARGVKNDERWVSCTVSWVFLTMLPGE